MCAASSAGGTFRHHRTPPGPQIGLGAQSTENPSQLCKDCNESELGIKCQGTVSLLGCDSEGESPSEHFSRLRHQS